MNYLSNKLAKIPGFGLIRTDDTRCFFPNKCHVCHRFDNEDDPLKKCSRCKIMTYCGRDHQLKDWKEHKELCNILKKLGGPLMFVGLKVLKNPEGASMTLKYLLARQRAEMKRLFFCEIASKLHRPTFFYEKDIMLHPRICSVCFESDPHLLKNCFNCPQASFCDEHKDDPSHAEICHLFKRSFDIEVSDPNLKQFFLNTYLNFVTFPHQDSNAQFPDSIEEFLKSELCVQVNQQSEFLQSIPENLRDIFVVDLVSRPLTILHALKKLEYPETSDLTIHIIGSNIHEVEESLWDIILHWLPTLTNLTIFFVGPELKEIVGRVPCIRVCKHCKRKGLQLKIHVVSELYQEFLENTIFQKPDFIIAFNAGFISPPWRPVIKDLFTLGCSVVQTSFTEMEAFLDSKFVKSIHAEVEPVYYGPNPYHNYICERNTDDETIFTFSGFLTIYGKI